MLELKFKKFCFSVNNFVHLFNIARLIIFIFLTQLTQFIFSYGIFENKYY